VLEGGSLLPLVFKAFQLGEVAAQSLEEHGFSTRRLGGCWRRQFYQGAARVTISGTMLRL
jgi:hypothetical protein